MIAIGAGLSAIARFMTVPLTVVWFLAPATQLPDPPGVGHPRLVSATLSTGTPRLGESFDLTIIARIPGGHTVRFPDSLHTGTGVESVSAPAWSVAEVMGDSTEIVIVYPLRGMAWGRIAVPETELIVERAAESVGAEGLVVPWTSGSPVPGEFVRRPITPAWVEIPQVLPPAGPNGGFRPRPALDVVGSDWGPARIGLVSLLGIAGAGIAALLLGAMYRRVMTPLARGARLRALKRARGRRAAGIPPRDRALAELDELLAADFERAPRLAEYYARGTRSARGYLASVQGPRALARTYRELIFDLFEARADGVDEVTGGDGGGAGDESAGRGRARGVSRLAIVLRRAEGVRFGGAPTSAGETRDDLLALRDWVATFPPEDGAP